MSFANGIAVGDKAGTCGQQNIYIGYKAGYATITCHSATSPIHMVEKCEWCGCDSEIRDNYRKYTCGCCGGTYWEEFDKCLDQWFQNLGE